MSNDGGTFTPDVLFHVKLPVAPATTVNAWRDGVPPAPQPTHYEAWVSFPDLAAILAAATESSLPEPWPADECRCVSGNHTCGKPNG